MLNINKTIDNGKADYILEGRLDTMTAPDLEKDLKDSLDNVSELTMDFNKLDYISSVQASVFCYQSRRS